MPFDRFLIAPINTGLQQDLRPWLIMDDAFQNLQNCYVFRGRVRKRFGSVFMDYSYLHSRLRINIGTVASHTIPDGASQLQIGQAFSVNNDFFTITTLGAAALTLSTNPGATATINSTSNPNTVTFTGEAAGSTVYYYPANPVMGITEYDSGDIAGIDNHPTYAFDTQFAYKFTQGTGWARSGTGNSPLFHGTNLQYFWSTNWIGFTPGQITLYTTNYNASIPPAATDDAIWFTNDGTNWAPLTYSIALNNSPITVIQGNGAAQPPFIMQARIIVPFQGRLLLLNTIENSGWAMGQSYVANSTNTAYPYRCRFSQRGSPQATYAWLEPNQTNGADVATGGSYVDATTDEAIVSAEFIKDRLIVYFERSTYELAYTGNEGQPFVWQKLNTELGSMSTFSTVPFDKSVLTIGETGVHACNGSNVERIDNKIPDVIFSFAVDSDFNQRTYGIRDYETELVYWAFTSYAEQPTQNFNDAILVYNYRNGSWATNNDCFMCFGYLEQVPSLTWGETQLNWQQANFPWINSQQNQRKILGGTPEGFVLMIEPDISRNSPSMQISNITIPSASSGVGYVDLEIINHNLIASTFSSYISVENNLDTNNSITPTSGIYPVEFIIDANNVTIYAPTMAGTYKGGYVAATVSNIQFRSKQWNPYVSEDRNFYLQRIDFAVQKTANGQITIDYYPSSTELSMIEEGKATGAIMGNNVLETFPYLPIYAPLEQYQTLLWHPIYFQTTGTNIQISASFNETQITNPNIAWDDFQLEAMLLYTNRTSARLQ